MIDGRMNAVTAALIFVGAGSGGLLRYWLGGLTQSWWGPSFPAGTLMVNVTGCLAMGVLSVMLTGADRDVHRAALLVGFLGGYTTFSSFGRETLTLIETGAWWRAGGYVLASVMLSLGAVWAGAAAAKAWGAGGA
jgi:fluoride exporter